MTSTFRIIDAEPPVVSVTHSPASPHSENIVDLDVTASDNVNLSKIEVEYGTDKNATSTKTNTISVKTYSGSISTDKFDAGSMIWYRAIVYDYTEQNNNTTEWQSFNVSDGTKPEMSITVEPSAPTDLSATYLNVTVTDNYGLKNVTIRWTNTTGPHSTTYPVYNISNTTLVPIGKAPTGTEVTYNGTVYDNASYSNYTSSSFTVGDGTKPVINSVSATYYGSLYNVTLKINASDNYLLENSTIWWSSNESIDLNLWNNYTFEDLNISLSINSTDMPGKYDAGTKLYFYGSAYDIYGLWNNSSISNVTIYDNTPPQITVDHNPLNPNEGENVTLIANATDNFNITRICINYSDGTTETSMNFTNTSGLTKFNVTWDIGNFTSGTYITYNATVWDSDNNNITSNDTTFLVDSIDPVVNVSHSPDDVRSNKDVTIYANATDSGSGLENITIFYNINGTLKNSTIDLNNGTKSYNLSLVINSGDLKPEDNITYYSVTYDMAGNNNTSTTGNFIVKDPSPPVLSNINVPLYPKANENVVIRIHATDDTRLTSVVMYWNNSTTSGSVSYDPVNNASNFSDITTFDANASIGLFGAGDYITFYTVANDSSDNSNMTVNQTFYVDGEIPLLSATHTPISIGNDQTIWVNITASDERELDTVILYWRSMLHNGTAWSGWTALNNMPYSSINDTNFSANTSAIGSFNAVSNVSYYVECRDLAGNSNITDTVNITVNDVSKPAINIVRSPMNPTNLDEVYLNITVSDNYYLENFTIVWNNGTDYNQTFNVSGISNNTNISIGKSLSGQYVSYTGTVYDLTGLSNSTSGNYTTGDATKPTKIEVSAIKYGSNESAILRINASDNYQLDNVTLYWSTDNTTWSSELYDIASLQAYSTQKTIERYNVSTVIYFKGSTNDTAGNYNNTSVSSVTVYDNTPPAVDVFSSPDYPGPNANVTLSVDATDNYYLDNVTVYWSTNNKLSWNSTVFEDATSKNYTNSTDIGKFTKDTVIYYYATVNDSSGYNNSTSIGNRTVDGTKPVFRLNHTPYSPQYPDSVSIMVNATDYMLDNMTVNWKWTQNYWNNLSQTWNVTEENNSSSLVIEDLESPLYNTSKDIGKFPTNSTVWYNITGYDMAGNYNNTSWQSFIVGDRELPSIMVDVTDGTTSYNVVFSGGDAYWNVTAGSDIWINTTTSDNYRVDIVNLTWSVIIGGSSGDTIVWNPYVGSDYTNSVYIGNYSADTRISYVAEASDHYNNTYSAGLDIKVV
ncbi:MAG: hypothetical protein KAJ19_10770 [Gammaproteobacteria bacterium]|nr:hypothetical protein [Gammaproteobacteria bacterium]